MGRCIARLALLGVLGFFAAACSITVKVDPSLVSPATSQQMQIVSSPPQVAYVGVNFKYHVKAVGSPNPKFSATYSSKTPAHLPNPTWLSIDQSTGVLSGTPRKGDGGRVITVRVKVTGSPEDGQEFDITVLDPPAIDCLNPITVTDDGATFSVEASGEKLPMGYVTRTALFTAFEQGTSYGISFDAEEVRPLDPPQGSTVDTFAKSTQAFTVPAGSSTVLTIVVTFRYRQGDEVIGEVSSSVEVTVVR